MAWRRNEVSVNCYSTRTYHVLVSAITSRCSLPVAANKKHTRRRPQNSRATVVASGLRRWGAWF